MAGVRGAPGTKPSDIKSPVPSVELSEEAASFMADFEAPQMEDTPVAEGSPEMSAEASAFMADAFPDGSTPGEDQFSAEPGFLQANAEQFNPESFVTRLQAGLAANDTEKVGFLRKKYGDGNVALKEGKIYYRRDPKAKMKPLDPATFELISDIIPDFAREIVMEGAMLPAEIGGAIAGTAAGPGGALVGATAGRVASVPMANSVADGVANLAGVETDPNRDIREENLIGMGAEAALPTIGGKIAKVVGKRIPGTAAYKVAKEQGEREVIALSKQSKEVMKAADELEQEGIKISMSLNQVQPDSPDIQRMVKTVEQDPRFLNKQMEFAEGYQASLENTLSEIKKRANPTGAKTSATSITNAIETLDSTEAKAIDHYKRKAMAKLKNGKQQLPAETSELAINTMKELGFQPKRVKKEVLVRPGSMEGAVARGIEARKTVERVEWQAPKNLDEIAGRLQLTDVGQTRSLVNVLDEYGKLVSRGNEARLSDVERLINRMGPLGQKLRGTQAGATLGRIAGDLRKHRRGIIESGLDNDFEKQAFNAAMDDFGMIRSNTADLTGILDRDVTSKTLVNYFFKGGGNKEKIQALKAITGKDSAQWGALKEEFVDQLLVKHRSDGPTGFNSKAFLDDLHKNYGDDFIKEVLNDGKAGPNYDTVKNLLTVGKRIEAAQRGIKADLASEEVKKGLADLAIGFFAGIKFKMINGVSGLIGASGSKDNVIMEIFNRDGFEKYLAGYKGKNKGAIAKNIEGALMQYNAARAGSRKVKALTDVGKDLTKRGTRATIREDAMRTD